MPSKITFWNQMRGLLSTLPAAVGLMPTARLGTGTADSTTFLRGDQTYADPVPDGSVTLAMMANVGMETVFYRRTVFDGPPESRPLHELKTDLGLLGANTGDITINTLASTAYVIAAGTTGTDVNVSEAGSTITINVPSASATVRGVITTGAQTFGGIKTFEGMLVTSTTDVVCLDLRPHSSSTNHVQLWRNKSGAVKAWMSNTGFFVVSGGVNINNSYTNSTNYERGSVYFDTDVFTIGSYASGTGILRDIRIGVTGNKLGFFGTTSVAQPTTAVAAATFVAGAGTAVNDASTFDGYTIKQVVKALRNLGLLT